jgi:hypothetical protein
MRKIKLKYTIPLFMLFAIFGMILSYFIGLNLPILRPEPFNLYEAIM